MDLSNWILPIIVSSFLGISIAIFIEVLIKRGFPQVKLHRVVFACVVAIFAIGSMLFMYY